MSWPSASTSTEQFSHVIEVRFKSGHSSVSTDETVSSSNVTPIEISVLDPIFVNPNSHQSLITVFLRTLDIMMAFQNTLTTKVDKKERVESGRCNLWWVAIHHQAKSDKGDFPMRNFGDTVFPEKAVAKHLTGACGTYGIPTDAAHTEIKLSVEFYSPFWYCGSPLGDYHEDFPRVSQDLHPFWQLTLISWLDPMRKLLVPNFSPIKMAA